MSVDASVTSYRQVKFVPPIPLTTLWVAGFIAVTEHFALNDAVPLPKERPPPVQLVVVKT